jgi:hypothetical protein
VEAILDLSIIQRSVLNGKQEQFQISGPHSLFDSAPGRGRSVSPMISHPPLR